MRGRGGRGMRQSLTRVGSQKVSVRGFRAAFHDPLSLVDLGAWNRQCQRDREGLGSKRTSFCPHRFCFSSALYFAPLSTILTPGKNRPQISTLSDKLMVYPSLRFDRLNIDLMSRRILSNNDIKEVEDGAFDGLENLFEM